MEFSKFEQVMMAIYVGNTPQRKPSDMHMAVRIYDRLGLSPGELAKYDGRPWGELTPMLLDEDPVELELDAEEAKFVARVMVANAQFGARMLRLLIPLWERLHPRWEELGAK